MSYHSSTLPMIFVDEVPCTLLAKIGNNQITRAGGNTIEGPTFFPCLKVLMGGLVLKSPKFKTMPCPLQTRRKTR